MNLEQILDNRQPGKTWRAHNWHTVCYYDTRHRLIVTLVHHGTTMLAWHPPKRSNLPVSPSNVIYMELGWASKSDQAGMNRAFRHLGLPYYYSRKGNQPEIIDLRDRDSMRLPKYLREPEIRKRVYGYAA